MTKTAKILVHLLLLSAIVFPTVSHARELKKGMPFLTARNMLKRKGWQPAKVNKDPYFPYNDIDKKLVDAHIKEVEGCAMDKAVCIFNYKKGDRCFRLFTQGEEIDDMRVTHWTYECPDSD